ncbi:DUF922 domain-containing protein [Negadavirga shengliensis]|uniref:Peptidase n=1 Tax=Negadavirga shengliensis TaxID=1389218 RepID=A0ABV9T6U4_9BACT
MASHKHINLLLLIGVLLLLIRAHTPLDNDPSEKVLVFPKRALQWEDFKQVPKVKGKSSINAICLSSCDVKIKSIKRFETHVKLDIIANIKHQKELSEVSSDFLSRADESTKKAVLHHENGHFIIAQIIGHRIVRDVQGYQFHPKDYKHQLNDIIRENFREWRMMDALYDAETTKPRDAEKQRKWDRFFQEELETLRNETK